MRPPLFLLLVACSFSPADLDLEGPRVHPLPAPAPDSVVASPPPVKPMHRDMVGHDELGFQARASVVAGDLAEARAAMALLATRPFPAGKPDLVSPVLNEARAGERAATLEEAGVAIGRIGAACAGCHREHPARRYPPSGYEEGDQDLGDRMTRHGWAVDAMWQGLVEPSDLAWEAGARSLATRDLPAVPGFPDDPDARAWAPRLAEAAKAAALATGADRAPAFGRVLATCAGCHRATGGGPGVEPSGPEVGP